MAAIVLAVLGGGNAVSTIPEADFVETAPELQTEHDPDLAPAPYAFPAIVEAVAQIEATPTPAAIAIPTVTAAATADATLRTSGYGECPAVIVETFGEQAPAACAVVACESGFNPSAIGDNGASLGLFQLWTGWATWYGVPVDALFDPATNAAVARAVLEHRGRWGGAGGWTCADLLNIW